MRLSFLSMVLLFGALTACSPAQRKCADSCLGCCDLNGQCKTGNTVDFCGGSGVSCRSCAQNQICQINTCVLITGGSGGGFSGTGGGASAGGSTAGGLATAGGSTAGGIATAGGASAGGLATAGGSTAGGLATGGGSTAGGLATGGGSTAGGLATGGGSAGGLATGGGSTAGGTATGCGTGPACVTGKRCVSGVCVCDGTSCPSGCCSSAGNCVAMSPVSCNVNGGTCVSCGVTANACTTGVCMCGSNAACSSGQRCSAGSCVCDSTSCPTGCCSASGICETKSAATCGTAGAACTVCGANADNCSTGGTCNCGVNLPCSSTQSCVSGTCQTVGVDWLVRTGVTMPSALYATAVVWDSNRQRMVLFGGRLFAGTRVAETWELGPTGWTQRMPTTSPPARSGHDMAYDPVRQRVILFGGFPDTGARYGDTWEWDGTTWTARTPAMSPSARSGHRMVWDPVRNVIMLFGGRIDGTSSFYMADTWTWNGTTWSPGSANGPSAREGVALAWDPNFMGGRVVLFGGLGNNGNRADTYAWDGSTWTPVTLTTSPVGRVFHDMVYSPVLGKILLFGGSTGGSASATFYGDTWVFDRTTWTQLMPTTLPGARNGHSMEFDPTRNHVMLFSGYNGTSVFGDQWEY